MDDGDLDDSDLDDSDRQALIIVIVEMIHAWARDLQADHTPRVHWEDAWSLVDLRAFEESLELALLHVRAARARLEERGED